MAEPITLSLSAIAVAKFCGDVVLHVGYHESHHFYREFVERWQDSPIDPATGLPRNHDLQEASRKALREAAQVLVMELAGQLEPSKPWIPRLVQHVREGKLGKVPLIEAGRDPQREWVETLREAIAGPPLDRLHDRLLLSEDDVRQCFAGGDLCAEFGPRLADAFVSWARHQVGDQNEPSQFEHLARDGWNPGESHNPVTLIQAYCLFFREHLKRHAPLFRILVTDTLNEIRSRVASRRMAFFFASSRTVLRWRERRRDESSRIA